MSDKPKGQTGQSGPPEVNVEQPKIDKDVLRADPAAKNDEEPSEQFDGQIPVDERVADTLGSNFDLIGSEGDDPKDGGVADFGVDLGAITGRDRQAPAIGSLLDDGTEDDTGGDGRAGPSGTYGKGMIEAGSGDPSKKVHAVEERFFPKGHRSDEFGYANHVIIYEDGTIVADYPNGQTVTKTPNGNSTVTPTPVGGSKTEPLPGTGSPSGGSSEGEPPADEDAGEDDVTGGSDDPDPPPPGVDGEGEGDEVTGGSDPPDGPPPVVDPDYISPEERMRLGEEIGSMSPGVQKGGPTDSGDIDPVDEGNFYVEGGGELADHVKDKDYWIGQPPDDGEFQGGGEIDGSVGPGGNVDGNYDPPDDAVDNPSGPGGYEPGAKPDIETEPEAPEPVEDTTGSVPLVDIEQAVQHVDVDDLSPQELGDAEPMLLE